MKHRVLIALLCSLPLQLPSLALAQDDEEGEGLDDLMAGATKDDEGGDDQEQGEGEGEGDEEKGGDLDNLMAGDPERDVNKEVEKDFDADSMDDERPPEDPDAFIKPKDEEPEEKNEQQEDDGSRGFNLGLLVGYGISFEDVNRFGFGLGATIGYDLGVVSLGGRFLYHFGETVQEPNEDASGNPLPGPAYFEQAYNLWELGLDVGLDIDVGRDATIRPVLGVGFAAASGSSETSVSPYAAPGIAMLYYASESMYLGLDFRYQVVGATPSFGGLDFLAAFGLYL